MGSLAAVLPMRLPPQIMSQWFGEHTVFQILGHSLPGYLPRQRGWLNFLGVLTKADNRLRVKAFGEVYLAEWPVCIFDAESDAKTISYEVILNVNSSF